MATFTNQASLFYNGITTNSNIVTGEVTQVITAWKDATVDTYQNGDIMNYVVSIQNSGSSPINGITVTDNLGAYTVGTSTYVPLTYTGDPVLYYQNGILQTSPTVTAGPPLIISNISVLPETATTLVYRAAVNQYANLGVEQTITNTATVSGGGITDVVASETITNDPATQLSILKAINPTTVVENGQVEYTFTITNTGATAATSTAGIVVSDTFTPVLSNIVATLNGETWPQVGNYSYNTATGEFQTLPGRITVPAATFSQDPTTGIWSTVPGVTTLTITGTI